MTPSICPRGTALPGRQACREQRRVSGGAFATRSWLRGMVLSVVLVWCLCVLFMPPSAAAANPNAENQFIWVGLVSTPATGERRQFTDEQVQHIADNYSYAIIEKFHAGYDMEKQFEDASRIKSRNRQIRIMPYFSASFWFKQTEFNRHLSGFRDAWFLRGAGSGPVPNQWVKPGLSFYVDLTNREYRNWATGVIESWLSRTVSIGSESVPVYDGIAFDSAHTYRIYGDRSQEPDKVRFLINRIGVRNLEAWNEGLKLLIRETKTRLGSKEVLFNGIEDKVWIANRSMDLFVGPGGADIALDENFFVGNNGVILGKKLLLENIDLMLKNTAFRDKKFLQKANLKPEINRGERSQWQRYSYGCFLLGHRPGHTFYKYAEPGFYGVMGEIGRTTKDDTVGNINPKEPGLNFGTPIDPFNYRREGKVFVREFEKGVVYVNMEDQPQTVTLSRNVAVPDLAALRASTTVFPKGHSLTIPPEDAAFFLFP